MKWEQRFDVVSITNQTDKYGNEYNRGNIVGWASCSGYKPHIIDGTVIGFTTSPSFIYTVIKTKHNRIVKKDNTELIVIK